MGVVPLALGVTLESQGSPGPRLILSASSICQIAGQRVTLPVIPSNGIFVGLSGRFVELRTTFGLRVRWDGDKQLFVTVPR